MTLTRPAYEITVENIETGWTASVTAGDTADPDADLWLADGLEMSWRFDGPPPAQLEPETVKFTLLAKGIANLPEFTEGDRISVRLERPTLTDPITYMDFAGRITDADLVTIARLDRLILELTAVDPTSELTHDVSNEDPALKSPIVMWGDATKSWADYYLEEVSAGVYRWTDAPLVVHKGSTAAAELAERVLPATAASPSDRGSFAVQRYVADEITDSDWVEFSWASMPSPWKYFLAQWRPQPSSGVMPTLYEYAFDAGDTDKVTIAETGPTSVIDGAVTVLDAKYMPDGAAWIKDRSLAPNRIIVKGLDAATAESVTPGVARDYDAVIRFGAIVRNVETAVVRSGLPYVAEEYLNVTPKGSPNAWMLKDTTILTHLMDDATLDAYADQFWTPREPVPGVMGRPMLVLNVDDEVDPTVGFMFAHLVGATFKIAGGKLAIETELVPAPAPAITPLTSDAPSYDGFGASAFGNATYHDQGGTTDYIDPNLTYDQAKLTAL